MELKGKKINFLGDSITEGCGTTGPDKAFHQVMLREYGLAAARNYGVGGTRIARQQVVVNEAFDIGDFCRRALDMDPDADAVVVFGGTNDFGHGDAPLGTFDDRDPNTYYGACHCLFTELLERYPDAPIFVCTPLHRTNEDNARGDGLKPYHYGTLKVYVDILREVAEYYSLPVIDLYANSGIQPKVGVMMERYMPDGLHPNDAGHARLAHLIGNFLLSY